MSGKDGSLLNNNKQLLESLDPECNPLKHAYDACFNSWFTETFLKGSHDKGPSPCDVLLKSYSDCVKKAIKVKKIELNLFDVGDGEIAKKKTKDEEKN